MAHAEHEPHVASDAPWDGAVSCRLCGDRQGLADHEWCPAAEALVCDDCCEALLRGEPRRLIAAAEVSPRGASPLDLALVCTGCRRLHRMLADDDEEVLVAAEEEPGTIH
jgi:hypothetical protein